MSGREWIQRMGLVPGAGEVRRWVKLACVPSFRRREAGARREFQKFRAAYGEALGHRLTGANPSKIALVASVGFPAGVQAELGFIKGLEMAGFEPVVLTRRDRWIVSYYRLAGIRRILFWDQFVRPVDRAILERLLTSVHSFDDLLALTFNGARIGRTAASTAFRNLRTGSLDPAQEQDRRVITQYLSSALAHAAAGSRILEEIRPDTALFVDRGYTPQGELFDQCVAQGIPAITWNAGHKGNAVILKRYNAANQDEHPVSLSEASWQEALRMPWTPSHRQKIREELFQAYASGDWYSEVGTQFQTKLHPPEEIRQKLNLDPQKKTAVIFAHILWDGTFFWGKDLFSSYEEWLVETVQAACTNTQVNWLLKIHPANIIKDARDGFRGEPAELRVIRTRIGSLPPHITLIPPDSDITTYSLFEATDYCVTVRGTVGIEAALFGSPVLTAGTGRYDRKGFTVDSNSRREYLERLEKIQEIPRLTPAQQELAERFAYSAFLLRPFRLKTFTLEYRKDAQASIRTQIRAASKEEWLHAPDMQALAAWFSDPSQEDYFSLEPDRCVELSVS